MTTCVVVENDCREVLRDYQGSADLIMTSPPYADARKGQYDSIHPDLFADWFLSFHQPFWDALKDDGSLVINIKDKIVKGVRHRYVWETILKLTQAGWFCIDDFIWHKKNPMPGYWPSRLRDGWEYCFHLSKSKKPYMDQHAVRIPMGDWAAKQRGTLKPRDRIRHDSTNGSRFGRNLSHWAGKSLVLPSNVLHMPNVSANKKHPAAFPLDLPSFFIKLLSRKEGLVIDPFGGSGSTGVAALNLGRKALLIDNKGGYCAVARERIAREVKASA
jgi:site-specific DNA-methyltransferase (adenine-specific)/site-specific DNA-methyltransferase (cytosine-N4-specific)